MFIIINIYKKEYFMNKLKKVGLTALATTLVASSAFAGEMSVSGSASLNYSGLNTASGNPWSMGDSVVFSGGGDLDNGMTVSVSYELDGGNYDDYSLSLGLGDGLGTLGFSGGSTSPGGIDSVKDIIPTAYTPVYENTDATDNGLATISGRNQTSMWGYKNTVGDVAISIGYNPTNSGGASVDGAETSVGITYSPSQIEGLSIVAGSYDDEKVAEATVMGVKYTMGSITAAYQTTEVDYDASGTADQDSKAYGVSFAVNENLSLSAGALNTSIAGKAVDEENTGVSASYTVGSITIAGALNKVDNIGGTSGSNAEVSSLNIAFAF
jgi:outer membrane protein OmpU